MNQRKIDDEVLITMLRDGKLQKDIATFFKVSPVAVCKRIKRLFPKPETILDKYTLTDKEKSFVMQKAMGKSNTQAVIASQYEVTSMESAKVIGSQLMDKPEIQESITALMDVEGLTRRHRIRTLKGHVDNKADPHVSLKALDMALKLANDYPAQKNINLNLNCDISPVDLSKYKRR